MTMTRSKMTTRKPVQGRKDRTLKTTSHEALVTLLQTVTRAAEQKTLEDVALTLETELTGGDLSEAEGSPIFKIMEAVDFWLFAVLEEHNAKHPEMSTEEMWDALRKMQANIDKTERMMKRW